MSVKVEEFWKSVIIWAMNNTDSGDSDSVHQCILYYLIFTTIMVVKHAVVDVSTMVAAVFSTNDDFKLYRLFNPVD